MNKVSHNSINMVTTGESLKQRAAVCLTEKILKFLTRKHIGANKKH